jgi:hypothetical protein
MLALMETLATKINYSISLHAGINHAKSRQHSKSKTKCNCTQRGDQSKQARALPSSILLLILQKVNNEILDCLCRIARLGDNEPVNVRNNVLLLVVGSAVFERDKFGVVLLRRDPQDADKRPPRLDERHALACW